MEWGNSAPYRPLIPPPPAHLRGPRDGLVQGLEEQGTRGSAVWGAKLGSDGSPRRGRRVKGQSRGDRSGRLVLWAVMG